MACIVIFDPSASLTCIVVTSLFLSGSNRKFYWALDFLANLFGALGASPKVVPEPEKATYGGGGGGTNFSPVLSERLTESPPFGYLDRSFLGINLDLYIQVPFVQFLDELFVLRFIGILELSIIDSESILIQSNFAN